MRRILATIVLVGLCAGCVTPYSRYLHPAHDEAYGPYDWRCVVKADGSVFWANDRGVHAIDHVVTDPGILCTWITPEQNCAGAPAGQVQACLDDSRRP